MVRIVTDSVSDVPAEIAQKLDITVIPILVRFGEEVYRDGIDISSDEFYQQLTLKKAFPHTAVPSPGDIARVYEELAEETDEILSIHLSSKYSGFYSAALTAKDSVKGKCQVEVIDTFSAIMGEGLLVITAAEEARKGKSLEQITSTIKKLVPKTHIRMAFDTLEYLKWGGRIGGARALIGSLLKIHPICGIKEGETIACGRERSRTKAIDWLYDFAKGFAGNIRELAVEYATTPEEAHEFRERLTGFFPRKHIYESQVGCVVGTHVGPHVISVCLIEK